MRAHPVWGTAESIWKCAVPSPAAASIPTTEHSSATPIPTELWPCGPSPHAQWAVLEEQVRLGNSSAP